MSDIGHNSDGQLKAFIDRIERMEEERKNIGVDIRTIYSEAKSAGFDPKIIRKVIARRKMDAADAAEQEALIETYLGAIGDLAGTPLGQAGRP